jgi:hypothetical protein
MDRLEAGGVEELHLDNQKPLGKREKKSSITENREDISRDI